MILRRLTEHVKAQNWFAVALDFVIVVAGVFIGIQVANWNQAQSDARLGRDYVQRLVRDLKQDQASISAQRDYYSAVLHAIRETDALLRATNPDPRALVINAYRATETVYTPPVQATWDQIVSSGHLGLLPRGVVESGLSRYYAFDAGQDIYDLGLESAYRHAVRRIIPMDIQAAIRAGCSDVRDKYGYAIGFSSRCAFDANPMSVKEAAAALRSNPAVAADLRYQYTIAFNATITLDGVGKNIKDVIGALATGAEPAQGSSR